MRLLHHRKLSHITPLCYFTHVYPFIYFIIAMYVHHLGLYYISFRTLLIPKINVALQLTKLWLKKVTTAHLFYFTSDVWKSAQHTHTHPFNGPFSGTTQVSWYQKGKTNLDFTEARDGEWQWHQLGHMQVCTSLQTDNHASTPTLSFLQAGCPSCHPTNSVKALKASQSLHNWNKNKKLLQEPYITFVLFPVRCANGFSASSNANLKRQKHRPRDKFTDHRSQ